MSDSAPFDDLRTNDTDDLFERCRTFEDEIVQGHYSDDAPSLCEGHSADVPLPHDPDGLAVRSVDIEHGDGRGHDGAELDLMSRRTFTNDAQG
jgi:hypothetical protein